MLLVYFDIVNNVDSTILIYVAVVKIEMGRANKKVEDGT